MKNRSARTSAGLLFARCAAAFAAASAVSWLLAGLIPPAASSMEAWTNRGTRAFLASILRGIAIGSGMAASSLLILALIVTALTAARRWYRTIRRPSIAT